MVPLPTALSPKLNPAPTPGIPAAAAAAAAAAGGPRAGAGLAALLAAPLGYEQTEAHRTAPGRTNTCLQPMHVRGG